MISAICGYFMADLWGFCENKAVLPQKAQIATNRRGADFEHALLDTPLYGRYTLLRGGIAKW
jgi:hypothetical protein